MTAPKPHVFYKLTDVAANLLKVANAGTPHSPNGPQPVAGVLLNGKITAFEAAADGSARSSRRAPGVPALALSDTASAPTHD